LDVDWRTCIDIDECKLQDKLKLEQRCNYDCVNTIGSFKCIESAEIGADQPQLGSDSNDFDDYAMKVDDDDDIKRESTLSDDAEGNYDIIVGGGTVSECLNGYYFNETMGDCQGTLLRCWLVINSVLKDDDVGVCC